MFLHSNSLISIGQLPDVLDGKGVTAHTLRFTELYDKRYEIEVSLSIQSLNREANMLKDHIGFVIPMLSVFDASIKDALTSSSWKLKKILIATTEYKTPAPLIREQGTPFYVSPRYELPTLRGCAQLLPFSDVEKLLCDIHGISYE